MSGGHLSIGSTEMRSETAPHVSRRLFRECVAAIVALTLASAPFAQTSPAPAKTAPPAITPGGIWTQVPAESETRPIPLPSDSALRGPAVNGVPGPQLPE